MEQMVLSTSRVSEATSVQLKARGTTSFKNTNSRKQTSTTLKKKEEEEDNFLYGAFRELNLM